MSDTDTPEIPVVPGNILFVLADKDGRITVSGSVPYFMLKVQPIPDGGSLVEGEGYGDTHYVKDGVITERQSNPSAISGMKITGIPNPSTITIGNELPVTVEDGEVDLEFDYPGTYAVLVQAWPYMDVTFQVTQP